MLEINQIHELGVAYLSVLNTCICHCSFNNRKGEKEARFCDLWLNELTLTSRINELVPRRALTDVASRGVQAGGVPAIWRSVIFTFINVCKEQQRGRQMDFSSKTLSRLTAVKNNASMEGYNSNKI